MALGFASFSVLITLFIFTMIALFFAMRFVSASFFLCPMAVLVTILGMFRPRGRGSTTFFKLFGFGERAMTAAVLVLSIVRESYDRNNQ